MNLSTVKAQEGVNVMPWKCMGEWRYISIHYPGHKMDASVKAWCPSNFTPGESASSTYCLGGWAGPMASLDVLEKRQIFVSIGKPMMI